jgi:hypothetical protein
VRQFLKLGYLGQELQRALYNCLQLSEQAESEGAGRDLAHPMGEREQAGRVQ